METLNKFYSFVKEITQDNSRNYKLKILEKYADDEDIKYYLKYLYDPYLITGISDKKLEKDFPETLITDAIDKSKEIKVKALLDYILENHTGKDIVLILIKAFKKCNFEEPFTLKDAELLDLLDAIITKNLQLGIDVLSINKVIPNLCRTFNVQLANKYFDKPENVEGKYFALTTKIDGGRIIALKENGVVSFWTRAGQPYEGLVDLENEMLEKLPDNICLDGEITLLDKSNLSSKDQYKQTMKITRKLGEKHGVKMLVFDCMTAEEFRNQTNNTLYLKRRSNLFQAFAKNIPDFCICTDVPIACDPCDYYNALIKTLNQKYTYFSILPYLYLGNDTSEILKWLNYNINRGEEGVMINMINAPYEFKRTSNLLKVKRMNDLDLEIVGYFEGENSNKGKLGGFIVNYKGNQVKVGSGYSKEFREAAWKNPNEYIGQTLVVQYFEETQNQNGGISLRFPTSLGVRTDK